MAKMTEKPPVVKLPWDAVQLTQSEISSIKAVSEGVAEPEQQRIAYWAIVHKLCAVDGMSFTVLGPEDGRRASDFAEGKRWVGNTLRNDIVTRDYPINPRGAPPPMPDQAAEAAKTQKDET